MKKNKLLTVTNVVILICILVYVVDRFILFDSSSVGIMDFKINGQPLSTDSLLFKILGFGFGRLYEFMAYGDEYGKSIYRLITYIFMHQFLIHMIVNLIPLYIVGNKMEKNNGSILTLFVFMISGIIGLLITNLIVPGNSVSAGASIAVFGLMGANLAMCFTNKEYIKTFSKKEKILLIIYGLVFTYTSGSWTMVAHNTGLILGVVIYLIYYYLFYKKLKNNCG